MIEVSQRHSKGIAIKTIILRHVYWTVGGNAMDAAEVTEE